MSAILQVPEKAMPLYTRKDWTYCALYGPRGTAKSYCGADWVITMMQEPWMIDMVALITREIQKTIGESSHALIKQRIIQRELSHLFRIKESYIECLTTGARTSYDGMRTNPEKILSKLNIGLAWIEEASTITLRSWELLDPTANRNECFKALFTYNKRKRKDVVSQMFNVEDKDRIEGFPYDLRHDPEALIIEMLQEDNPFMTRESNPKFFKGYDRMRKASPQKWLHHYKGAWLELTDAKVYPPRLADGTGYWWTEDLDDRIPSNARVFLGADAGFAKSKATLVEGFTWTRPGGDPDFDKVMYIRNAVGGTGLATPKLKAMYNQIESVRNGHTIIMDNAAAQQIADLRNLGVNIQPSADKNVAAGIAYVQGFDIVIHPALKEVIFEFENYEFEVDSSTEEVLEKVRKENDHYCDAIRYGVTHERFSSKKKDGRYSGDPNRNIHLLAA